MNLTKIYLDMDGVIADFDNAIIKSGLVGKSLKMVKGIYAELDVFPGAREGVTSLLDMGFIIHIATKIPDDNPYAATEKLLWLRKHFPELAVNVTITPDKGQLGLPEDYLIDDRPHKANVENFQGTLLHFGENGVFKNWDSVVNYFKQI